MLTKLKLFLFFGWLQLKTGLQMYWNDIKGLFKK